MAKAEGKQCDFCGCFISQSEGATWTMDLKVDKIPARFEGDKAPPDICAECVAKSLEALGCAVEPVAKDDGEVQSIIIRSYRRM